MYESTPDDIQLLNRIILHYQNEYQSNYTVNLLIDLVTRMTPLCGAVPPVHTVPGISCTHQRGHEYAHQYYNTPNDVIITWPQHA